MLENFLFVLELTLPFTAQNKIILYTNFNDKKEDVYMAKKDLSKIDLAIEEAKKKVASLENERKLAEENLQKNIGKLYVQIQLKKDKTLSYETIQKRLKTELLELKNIEKEKRLAEKKEQTEPHQIAQNG